MYYSNTHIAKIFIIPIMLSVFFAPLSPIHTVREANASHALSSLQGVQIGVAEGNAAQNTVSATANTITAGGVEALVTKEFSLDGIAFNIAKMILKQITSSIVQWINSGFEGSPAFVTDLEGFLLDVADQAAGQFITGHELDFICSPFKLDVKIALALQYQADRDFTPKVQCTLSGSLENIQGFMSGTFEQGGWQSWFEITQNPQNTPTGAYLAAEAEMRARIVDAQGREIAKLNWGDGIFSKTLCELVEGEGVPQEKCFINMPGEFIAKQTSFTIQGAERSLIEANEINEIIGALFAQLAQQAITGINGILGLSASGYGGGGGSYLDAMLAEREGSATSSLGVIEVALNNEYDYQNLFFGVADDVDALELENAQNALQYVGLGCYTLTLPRELANYRQDAISAAVTADANIIYLEDILFELENFNISIEREQEIYTEFQRNQVNGTLRSQIDVARAEVELMDFDDAVDDFISAMDRQVDRCEQQLNNNNGGGGR